jgi:hypothetical protein
MYVPVLALLICLFGFRRLINEDYGLVLQGIRDNDQAVRASGINVTLWKDTASNGEFDFDDLPLVTVPGVPMFLSGGVRICSFAGNDARLRNSTGAFQSVLKEPASTCE